MKTPHTQHQSTQRLRHPKPDLVRLWVLRLLVPLGGQQPFINNEEYRADEWAEYLGAPEWLDETSSTVSDKAVRIRLRQEYRACERTRARARGPEQLTSNIARLSRLIGLSPVDCRILELAVLFHTERILDAASDHLDKLSPDKVPWVLSVLLDLPEQEIRQALSGRGLLAVSGMFAIDPMCYHSFKDKLNLLSGNLAGHLRYADSDPLLMLRDIILPGRPATLELADFSHVEPATDLLFPFLRGALATLRRGVNILFHGPPGTGKSELSRLLAREMPCKLFEVTCEDEDGDPIGGARRLRAFRAAQCFLIGQRSLICFDEVEDVFGSRGSSRYDAGVDNKSWVNRMLEENTVPTIWITNSVHGLDNAFIRRFDMVIELPVPPKPQREQIIRQACRAHTLPAEPLLHLAASEHLAPAVFSRALSVVAGVREELPPDRLPEAIAFLVASTLQAQGHRLHGETMQEELPPVYDPALINADTDLLAVAAGLARVQAGRLCLHGPPGTGKTAFGRWLAEHLGLPLVVKRASDILDMYVGGTERNIARAFAEASEAGALLLIDEVDSFLQDRRRSQRVWEVTEVNEMLVQIERFPGVLVASTNLIDGLDQAAMRRFDLKIRFDALRAEQAFVLLERHCLDLGLDQPDAAQRRELAGLPGLTPGDFAVVARQHRFRPITGPDAFLRALAGECALKESARKRPIGFLSCGQGR